jgi:hypothetical protein
MPVSESHSQHSGQQVTNVAAEATQHVAGTAKGEAQHVVVVSKEQARKAAVQFRDQVQDEADTQTRRLAQGLRAFAEDLSSMSSGAESGSAAQGLVREAAEGGRRAADWLEQRGVDGLLADMRSFARRRPGTFLIGAAIAGFGIGRLATATTKAETGDGIQEPIGSLAPQQRPFSEDLSSHETAPATFTEPGGVSRPPAGPERWE